MLPRRGTLADDLVFGAGRVDGRRGSRSWFRRERPRSGYGGCLGGVARLDVGGRTIPILRQLASRQYSTTLGRIERTHT